MQAKLELREFFLACEYHIKSNKKLKGSLFTKKAISAILTRKIKIKIHGMANLFQKILHKGRFIIVAAIVLTITSAPFMSNAGGSTQSTIQISASDTIAGLSSEIEVANANPFENLEVLVLKPSGNQLSIETVSDKEGKADLTLSDYHLREAGIYSVAAKRIGSNEKYSKEYNFEVRSNTVSTTKSTVELSKNTAEKGETVEMKAYLTDQYGNPINGHSLQVVSSKDTDAIYSPSYVTDKNGVMDFYISSETKGIATYTVLDTTVNKQLATQPKLAFLSGNEIYKEVGGWSNDVAKIVLAAESGPIDSFRISGLSGNVEDGESKTITVTALDADGYTVTDYTGEIRFSSSDDSATLPNDYTFLAEDQGEHQFNLAVKFVTTGPQILTVTDVDQFNITGDAEFDVVNAGNIGEEVIEVEPDFETEEFTREGDFTLISPASGSYSTNEIQIQGEADYGYSAIIYVDDEEAGRTEVDFDNSFSYTLENVDDGTYDIYVDIVDLGEGDPGEEEILEVIENSDLERIVIDTTAPELVSITVDPSGSITPGETIEITVLSEDNLDSVSVLLNEELYELEATAVSGKYQTTAIVPDEEGEVSVDVILVDALGNEVQYRDELTLTVASDTTEIPEEPVLENVLPGQVSGLTTSPGQGEILLTWEASEEGSNPISFYKIYYGPSPEALFASTQTYDSSTTWSITDLQGEDMYYIAVSAIDSEGNEGPLSGVTSSKPLAKAATEPTDIPILTTTTITETGTPGETPDSGPETTAIISLSLALALGYTCRKKLSIQKI
ncbi:Ig-like domain-containing protein [Patescibacteria group bacterium]|nr:Ig-like domain-containing protein [Patescibacteria group bacterium]